MLSSSQEIHPAYLRTLRQTLNEVILPEVTGAAARGGIELCAQVLARMIAALESVPELRRACTPAYDACLTEAATCLGIEREDKGGGLTARAADLQDFTFRLFAKLNDADAAQSKRITETLAHIAETEAVFRDFYEHAAQRAAASNETGRKMAAITLEAVQAYLRQRFFAAAPRVRDLRHISGGRSKLTVFVSLDPSAVLPAELVFRFDNPGSAQATAVSDEFPVIQALYAKGVSAPEVLWLETNPASLGARFLVMRRMPGSSRGSYWSAENVPPALGTALGASLAGLHAVAARDVWPASPIMARDAVTGMIADLETRWRESGQIISVTLACAYGWLHRHLDWITGPAVPVHGDVHFANVLAEGDRLICLTDWEFAHPGHPAEDLAFSRGYIEQLLPWQAFLDSYITAGGGGIRDQELRFFAVWSKVRNITLASAMLSSFGSGAEHDVQDLSIGLNAKAKLEWALSRIMAEELQRE